MLATTARPSSTVRTMSSRSLSVCLVAALASRISTELVDVLAGFLVEDGGDVVDGVGAVLGGAHALGHVVLVDVLALDGEGVAGGGGAAVVEGVLGLVAHVELAFAAGLAVGLHLGGGGGRGGVGGDGGAGDATGGGGGSGDGQGGLTQDGGTHDGSHLPFGGTRSAPQRGMRLGRAKWGKKIGGRSSEIHVGGPGHDVRERCNAGRRGCIPAGPVAGRGASRCGCAALGGVAVTPCPTTRGPA